MKISLLTDVGLKRSNNQDYVNRYYNRAHVPLIVLADGMGGHRAGNIASEMTATDLGKAWVNTEIDTTAGLKAWFDEHLQKENQRIYELGQTDDYKGMGTTLEVMTVINQELVYAHVGDSRIAVVRDGKYEQLTSDHSLVNALVQAGEITAEEAENHPQKNIITQSIGQKDPIQAEVGTKALQAGDVVVMNSDGLTNMVSAQAIVEVLKGKESLDEKAKILIQKANQAGGLDNITVALVHIDEEAAQ